MTDPQDHRPAARALAWASLAAILGLAGCARIEEALGIPAGDGPRDALIVAAFGLLIFVLVRRGRQQKREAGPRRRRRRRRIAPEDREWGNDGGNDGP